jgi:hypothetical protein
VRAAFGANGGEEDCVQVICRKSRKKKTTRKTKLGWKDNIKMDLVEVGWGGVDWVDVAQDRYRRKSLVNIEISIRAP